MTVEFEKPGEYSESTLAGQLSSFLRYYYSGIELSPQALEIYPGTENVKVELERKALAQSLEIVARNNAVADILTSTEFRNIQQQEIAQKGPCAVGASDCIDGRLPAVHLFAFQAGVYETMAGVLDTYKSEIDGRTRLESKTLEQSISAR